MQRSPRSVQGPSSKPDRPSSAPSLMQIKGLVPRSFLREESPFVEEAALALRVLAGRARAHREVARASSSEVLPEITSQSTMAVD